MICTTKANELLESLFSKTIYSVVSNSLKTTEKYFYIGLHTSANGKIPQPDGSDFDEPSLPEGATDEDGKAITENEYKRVRVYTEEEGKKMGDAAGGVIKNEAAFMWPEAEHYGWGEITHIGIFENANGGTPILIGELNASVTIPQGYIAVIRKNKFKVGLDHDPTNA